MKRGSHACADTGPFLHLAELRRVQLLRLFSRVFTSPFIRDEVFKHGATLPKNVAVKAVNNDCVALLVERFGVDLGEASVMCLCRLLDVELILTDDLEAREVSASLGLRPVGTIGIIARAFREGMLSKERAITLLKNLPSQSSLFVTSRLINEAILQIKAFRR